MRVLIVNVFFAPQSFGGGTMAAERLAAGLIECGHEVAVFSLRTDVPDTGLLRYDWRGATCFSLSRSAVETFPYRSATDTREAFLLVLRSFAPDLVHFHAVQGLGIDLVDDTIAAGLPAVVTTHDFWWLCERQFMITSAGYFCGQEAVDFAICEHCIPSRALSEERYRTLLATLARCRAVVFPSSYVADVYRANVDLADHRIIPNGFGRATLAGREIMARARADRAAAGRTAFGFIGGPGILKGYEAINRVFSSEAIRDAELLLVDAGIKVGSPWYGMSRKIPRHARVSPPFEQDRMDDFYGAIDVLLAPSNSAETFGLAVYEALDRDKWVIAGAVGGPSDCIESGVNGRLLPLGFTDRQLMDAIEEARAIDHTSYRNRRQDLLGEPGVFADGHLALYRDCVSAPRPGRA
jgi:glycosyltransferase involved in cell wall biosynthesis